MNIYIWGTEGNTYTQVIAVGFCPLGGVAFGTSNKDEKQWTD
ncbi:hypothetical protein [Niallia sp. 03133]